MPRKGEIEKSCDTICDELLNAVEDGDSRRKGNGDAMNVIDDLAWRPVRVTDKDAENKG